VNLVAVSLMLAVVFTALAVSTRFVRRLHGLGFTFAVLAVGSLAVAHPWLFISQCLGYLSTTHPFGNKQHAV